VRHPDRLGTHAAPLVVARDVHGTSHHRAETPKKYWFCQGQDPSRHQAQLVDQRRRLETDARPLTGHVAGRHAVQLLVDEGQHALERIGTAGAPRAEQRRDVAAVPRLGLSAHASDPGQV
jgi:hypothetical protein